MSMSESGRNPPLVAEPKTKTCVAPILRNRFAAAVRASFSMKTVVIFDARRPRQSPRFLVPTISLYADPRRLFEDSMAPAGTDPRAAPFAARLGCRVDRLARHVYPGATLIHKMSRVYEGQLSAGDLRFAIIVSRFNSFITERLLGGAMDALTRTGANPDLVDVIKVPGSWELPLVAGEVARQKRYDAVICLSAVIRGETPHFDYVAAEAAKGIAHVAVETGVPVAFGVLTTNTW